MKEKNQVVPDEVLSKEFISQFKTEADVSKFLKQLHAQVLEKMLEGEMDAHLGYEKNSVSGNNSGNSRNGSYPKKIQTEHGEAVISIPRDRNGQFEPIAVPKHESRGLSIEKLVISLYAKGMSVSDIEEEMREIYEIELSTSAISIITNKVNQAALEWQNRPLDPVYLIVWMDGIVFKVRDNGKIINKTVYLSLMEIEKKWTQPIHNWGLIMNQFMLIFENRIQIGRYGFLHLKLLEHVLHFGIVFQQVCIDFGCALFQLVGASVLYPLFVGIPFGYVNPVACCKLDALACVYDTHTDRHVLYDWHTVLLPALQCKNDVTFDIHNWVRLKFYTQIYTQKLK